MLLKDFENSEEINHFSQESKGFDYWNGQYRDLRVPQDFFEETVSRLRLVLGKWCRILHMRKMHAAYGKESTIKQRQIWHIVDSWIRNKEEPIPRSWAWSIIASNNVSQSTWHVTKRQTSKEWSVPNYSWKMEKEREMSRGFVWAWMDRTNQTVRRTCLGRPFLWSYTYTKGDDGRRTGTWFKIMKDNKVQRGNALIFVKRSKPHSQRHKRTCLKYRRRN